MWRDILNFIGAWLYEGFTNHPADFQASLIGALVVVVTLWVAGVYYPYLFNRRFLPGWDIQAACALASLPSLFILLVLFCSRHAPAALSTEIDQWARELAQGSSPKTAQWHYARALETYNNVRALNNGDLAGVTPPTTSGATLTLTKPDSLETMSHTYSTAAVGNFIETHPYLSRILTIDPLECEVALNQRTRLLLRPNGNGRARASTLSAREAVELAAGVLKSGIQGAGGLNAQFWRSLVVLRIALALSLLVIQLIPFTWNGWTAYQDIRIPAASL